MASKQPKSARSIHPVSLAITASLLFAFGFLWFIREPDSGEAAPREPIVIGASGVVEDRTNQTNQTDPNDPSDRTDVGAAVEPPPRPDLLDTILRPDHREIPGRVATGWLYYRNDTGGEIRVAGSWDGWEGRFELTPVSRGLYAFDMRPFDVPFGRYEFKFIVDGQWEPGENRLLHLNEHGRIERPPQVIAQALIDEDRLIRIRLNEIPEARDAVSIEMEPDYGVARLEWVEPEVYPHVVGYRFEDHDVEFVFSPGAYGLSADAVQWVSVAGAFNGWDPNTDHTRMLRTEDNEWTVRIPYAYIDGKITDEHIFFKFVVNGEWMNPPADAPNARVEPGTPHMNLTLPRGGAGRPELLIHTVRDIDLSNPPGLILDGLHERRLRTRPSPDTILNRYVSDKALGATLDRDADQTHFRIFSPRAVQVDLGLFDGPYHRTAEDVAVEPAEILPMTRDGDGVWEIALDGLRIGQYYAFRVSGPRGDGEGFNPNRWLGDPYAFAVSLAEGNSIVMDLRTPQAPWRGWTPEASALRIPWEDMVIYETHVRHFTWDDSSEVQADLRGSYLGFLATDGLGTGLDHLKALGVNVVQFMPIHEFPNGFEVRHDWGYATDFFFAPESSFAQNPREGSQVWEFRHVVNELKEHGFAVFLDVVYNHIGGVNVFNAIDRLYYFRLNPDFTNMNFSGVGNDVHSERPMVRRLIVENVLFWVEEYGIDGFRFDLGELIDDDTLLEIEREIRAKHPHVVLHSEPWSFRGHHKDFIGRTTWGAWNDQFREPAKRFVSGRGDVENLQKAIRGSVEGWAQHPLQSVNYMESHDDYSLVDELTSNPERDGRELSYRDERIHKLAATLIMGSLGTPMITEGQDWMRSKHGIRNTYNQGDELNALRWNDRDRPHALEVTDYYAQMIHFRLSDAGRALRVAENPGMEYVRFIRNGSETALGWMVNANNERPGVPAVMILMNAGAHEATFAARLPNGRWIQVGDGDQVAPGGLPGEVMFNGGRTQSFTVPARTAHIFRNGL
jgi:pullulanase/glycogen debranching enzyme